MKARAERGLGPAALAAGAALALLMAPRQAPACDCRGPSIWTWPEDSTPAPTNAVVRIAVNRGAPLSRQPVTSQPFAIQDTQRTPVPARRRDTGMADVAWVELAPLAPLAPETTYRIVAQTPRGDWLTVGTFRTGSEPDREPPRLDGIARAFAIKEPSRPAQCWTGDLFAALDLAAPGPDGGADPDAAARLLYAVWLGPARKSETRVPLTYLRSHGGWLLPGHPSVCRPTDFVFHPRAGQVRLVIRAVDAAGNQSEAREVDVDLRSPLDALPH